MAIVLNLLAIMSGFYAIATGPAAPWRMTAFGLAAAMLFVWATILYPPGKDYGVECDRYSIFATTC